MAEVKLKKSGGKLVHLDPAEYQAFVDSVPEGHFVIAVLASGEPKTMPQLGLWYGSDGILSHALAAFEQQGIGTLGELKEKLEIDMQIERYSADMLFKRLWYASRLKPGVPSKASMTMKELSGLIDFTKDWVARNLDYIIP